MKAETQIIQDLDKLLEFESRSHQDKGEGVFLRDQIPAPILELHDHLRSRGQRSISVVKKGICSACKTPLPADQWLHLETRTRAGLNLCPKCGRIVFLADDLGSQRAPDPETFPSGLSVKAHAARLRLGQVPALVLLKRETSDKRKHKQ